MNDTNELTTNTRHLRTRLTSAMFALLIALVAVAAATYAWYIYNTSRHTTKVKMAAGTGINIQISNTYDRDYGSAAVLNSFTGWLTPVSTDKIERRIPEGRRVRAWHGLTAGTGGRCLWQR